MHVLYTHAFPIIVFVYYLLLNITTNSHNSDDTHQLFLNYLKFPHFP